MLKNQSDKYDCTFEGDLINTDTGEIIPSDEPVFILRARDVNTLSLLYQYITLVNGKENKGKMRETIKKFEDFSRLHPSLMKPPTL